MQTTFWSILGCTLLLGACATQPAPHAPVAPAPIAHAYHCASGANITASYPGADSADIEYAGNPHSLERVRSASGVRYAGDGLEWWTKGVGAGASGTLFARNADGTTGRRLETCVEQ